MSRTGVRRPLTRPRSQWEPIKAPPLPSTVEPKAWERRVHDGALRAFLTNDPGQGWHLSVSHVSHLGSGIRYPTWDELADARDALTDPHVEFAMILPRVSEYVALHDTTFHLHEVTA